MTHGAARSSLPSRPGSRMIEAFLENTVAYGGMRITAPRTGTNIGAEWQPIAPYDAETVEAIGCEFDLPSGAFTVKRPGVWRISLFVEATGRTIRDRCESSISGSATRSPDCR